MRTGDIIVTRGKWKPWYLIIPGYWKHVMIYSGNGNVIEAIGKGAVERSILDAIEGAKRNEVLRPTFCSGRDQQIAVDEARKMLGTPYDFLFTEGAHSIYCSELVWLSYKRSCNQKFPMKRLRRWWRLTVTPNDLAASHYFEKI